MFLALLVSPIASAAEPAAPRDDRTASPKVIGGEPVPLDDPGLFPFLVSVLIPEGGDFGLCTGSLVAPQWVLTAAQSGILQRFEMISP